MVVNAIPLIMSGKAHRAVVIRPRVDSSNSPVTGRPLNSWYLARAADVSSRLRFVFVYGANRQPATLAEIRRVERESIDPNPLAHLQIGMHPTAANYENTVAAQRLAEELGVGLNAHLHESPADPATGQMDALRRAGALRPGLLTNHTVQMTDAELDELATHDVRVAHNPLSNMRLASGIARVPDMRARNINVGLGLDGGTNDNSDMFANMKAAVGLQRAVSHCGASV